MRIESHNMPSDSMCKATNMHAIIIVLHAKIHGMVCSN